MVIWCVVHFGAEPLGVQGTTSGTLLGTSCTPILPLGCLAINKRQHQSVRLERMDFKCCSTARTATTKESRKFARFYSDDTIAKRPAQKQCMRASGTCACLYTCPVFCFFFCCMSAYRLRSSSSLTWKMHPIFTGLLPLSSGKGKIPTLRSNPLCSTTTVSSAKE